MASPTEPLLLLRGSPTKTRRCRNCREDFERFYFQSLAPDVEVLERVCIYCRVKGKVKSRLVSETGEDCFPADEDKNSLAFAKASKAARTVFNLWMIALSRNGIAIITVAYENGTEITNGDEPQATQIFVDNFMRLITQVAWYPADYREPLHNLLVTLGPAPTETPSESDDEAASPGDTMNRQRISLERGLPAEDVDDEEAATRRVLTRQRTNSVDRELLALAEDSDDPDAAPSDRAHHGYDGTNGDYDAGHHGYDGAYDDFDAADDGYDVVAQLVTVTPPTNGDNDFEMMETSAAEDWDEIEFNGFADDEDSAVGVDNRDNNASEPTSPEHLLGNQGMSELNDCAIKLEEHTAEVAALAGDVHDMAQSLVNYVNNFIANSANSQNGA